MNVSTHITFVSSAQETIFATGLRLLLHQSGQYAIDADKIDNISDIKLMQDTVLVIIWTESEAGLIMEGIKQLRSVYMQKIPVLIIMQTHVNIELIKQLVVYGRVGIATTDISTGELNSYIMRLKNENTGWILSPDLQAVLLDQVLAPKEEIKQGVHFNPTEERIIDFTRQGYNILQIAQELGLSRNTIAVYRSKILKKTGSRSMNQLVAGISGE